MSSYSPSVKHFSNIIIKLKKKVRRKPKHEDDEEVNEHKVRVRKPTRDEELKKGKSVNFSFSV